MKDKSALDSAFSGINNFFSNAEDFMDDFRDVCSHGSRGLFMDSLPILRKMKELRLELDIFAEIHKDLLKEF